MAPLTKPTKSQPGWLRPALIAALPIMAGYLVLGIPCGILGAQAGLNIFQIVLLSLLFYSGAGQYMAANLWLLGTPLGSIVVSIALVNSRQILYSASLSRFCDNCGKRLSLLFAATVTDESFGVNLGLLGKGSWSIRQATAVNLFSQASWTAATAIGAFIGALLAVPVAIAAFAMTSIFICLLFSEKLNPTYVVAATVAAAGVLACKLLGWPEAAIFVGAVLGVLSALIFAAGKKDGA